MADIIGEELKDENLCPACPLDILSRFAMRQYALPKEAVWFYRKEIKTKSKQLKTHRAVAAAAAGLFLGGNIYQYFNYQRRRGVSMSESMKNIFKLIADPDITPGLVKAASGGILYLVNRRSADPQQAINIVALMQLINGGADLTAGLRKKSEIKAKFAQWRAERLAKRALEVAAEVQPAEDDMV